MDIYGCSYHAIQISCEWWLGRWGEVVQSTTLGTLPLWAACKWDTIYITLSFNTLHRMISIGRRTSRFKGSIETSPTSSPGSLRPQQTTTKSAPTFRSLFKYTCGVARVVCCVLLCCVVCVLLPTRSSLYQAVALRLIAVKLHPQRLLPNTVQDLLMRIH